jgi:hypothetical protein
MLAIVAGISACADSGTPTTSAPATTTSELPTTTSGTTAAQDYRHLRDGSAITLDDLTRDLAITLGDRAELHLSRDYAWTDPLIVGPAELAAITPPDDAAYVAWELTTSDAGNLIISTTGTPSCEEDDCDQTELDFAISIVVRRP